MGRSGGGRHFGGRSSHHSSHSSHRMPATRSAYRPYRHRFFGNNGMNHNDKIPSNKQKTIAIWLFLIFWFAGIGGLLFIDSAPVPDMKSTIDRTPLAGQVHKTGWYEDSLDWVIYESVLIDGLEYFYERTGVQPYVLFVSYDDSYWQGNDIDILAVESYLNDYYESHFTDEGHLLLAYFASKDDSITEMDGSFYYLCGYEADSIMDEEAVDIFWTYLEHYYHNTSYNLEQMIGGTFAHTADVIMGSSTSVSTEKWHWQDYSSLLFIIPAVIVGVLVLLILLARTIGKREQRMLSETSSDVSAVAERNALAESTESRELPENGSESGNENDNILNI